MTNPMTTKELRALAEAVIAAKAHRDAPYQSRVEQRQTSSGYYAAMEMFRSAITPETTLALTARVEVLSASLNSAADHYEGVVLKRTGDAHFAALCVADWRAAINAKDVTP